MIRLSSQIRRIALFGLLMSYHLIFSQHTVSHIQSPDDLKDREGVVYTLPRTCFQVNVQVLKEEFIKGPYMDFAEKMLGISKVINRNQEIYSIESIQVLPLTAPDPQQIYLVEINDKSEQDMHIDLTGGGYLTGFRQDDKGEGEISHEIDVDFEEMTFREAFPEYQESVLKEERYTIRRELTIDTFMFEKEILRQRLVLLSDEEKAREAADIIEQIKQDKYNILIGYPETAYDRGALDFMIGRLEKMEFTYLSLFTGIKTSEHINFTYYYYPEKPDLTAPTELFNFSAEEGPDTESGSPVLVRLELNEGYTPSDGDDNISGNGFTYRIPATAGLVISMDDEVLFKNDYTVAQAGQLVSLPSNVDEVILDPETGNVLKVVLKRND